MDAGLALAASAVSSVLVHVLPEPPPHVPWAAGPPGMAMVWASWLLLQEKANTYN